MAGIGVDNQKRAPRFRLSPNDPPPPNPVQQFQANDLWPLVKQIDGLGGEWTFPIFMWRAMNFHIARTSILFYEPIADFERLSLEALLMQRQFTAMVPDAARGFLSIIVKVFPSIFDVQDGVLVLPEDGEPCIGQHTLTVLGLHDNDTLVFRNSWSGWKKDGIGYLSRDYFDRYGQEGSTARLWNRGPNAVTADALLRTTDSGEFRRLWRSGHRWGAITNIGGNKRLRLKWYECWSLQKEVPGEVLALELDGRIRVAVAILIHCSSVSVLSDLFVWPHYRRRGYGSLMEKAAADRARQAGSQELGIYVWDADAVHGSERGKDFLASREYDVERFEDCQAVMYGKRRIR